jgi:hypothetical protein
VEVLGHRKLGASDLKCLLLVVTRNAMTGFALAHFQQPVGPLQRPGPQGLHPSDPAMESGSELSLNLGVTEGVRRQRLELSA